MVIWSGLGFLVAVIAFGCLIATEYLVEVAFRDNGYYQGHGWPKFLAFLVAALIVGALSRWIHRRPGKVLIDPQTGAGVVVNQSHTLFFIPVKYWPPILVVLGVLFLFVTD